MATNTELIQEIISSQLPLDWVTLRKFSQLTGEKESWLYKLKNKLPEGVVWRKSNGKIYFSLVGWNTWHNNQTTQQALEYEEQASRLISRSMEKESTLRFPSRQQRTALVKQEKYVLT